MVGVNQRFFIQCNIFLENLWDRTVWDRIYFIVKKKKRNEEDSPERKLYPVIPEKRKKSEADK